MSGQHLSADRQRAHAAGQRNIVNYCDCGMAPRGNASWWSHTNAHPDHKQITYTQFLDRARAEKQRAEQEEQHG